VLADKVMPQTTMIVQDLAQPLTRSEPSATKKRKFNELEKIGVVLKLLKKIIGGPLMRIFHVLRGRGGLNAH